MHEGTYDLAQNVDFLDAQYILQWNNPNRCFLRGFAPGKLLLLEMEHGSLLNLVLILQIWLVLKFNCSIIGTFYKCTAANTWTSYYTPYIYPHPKSEGDLSPPTGLAITPSN